MDNYIGPYWSNGNFQSSVAYGKKRPKSRADRAARYHDTAYALYRDRPHRAAADLVFHNSLEGDGFLSGLMGDAVLYGNALFNPYGGNYTAQDMEDVVNIPRNDPYIDPIPMLGGGTEYSPDLVPAIEARGTGSGILFPEVGGIVLQDGSARPYESDPNLDVKGTVRVVDLNSVLTSNGMTSNDIKNAVITGRNLSDTPAETPKTFTSQVDAGQAMNVQRSWYADDTHVPLYER